MDNYILTGGRVVLSNIDTVCDIVVVNGIIVDIGFNLLKIYKYLDVITLKSDDIIMPGFIDVHIHGSNGYDVMDNSLESLKHISSNLFSNGVTSFLPTTMTADKEYINSVLNSVSRYITMYNSDNRKNNCESQLSEVLGVHLEGPFISQYKSGAQNSKFICLPDISMMKYWQYNNNNIIKKITIAPELNQSNIVVDWCKKNNIIVFMGHSNCTFQEAALSVEHGSSGVTHFFNAMSGCDHRNPGLVSYVLFKRKIFTELIVDNIHLNKDIVNMTYNIIGSDYIILITDAMSAQGKDSGIFYLGGQKVIVKNNEARLENGCLAGSLLTMNKAFLNIMKYNTNISLVDIVKMTSLNAAKSLNIDNCKGKISIGYHADLIVLDKYYQIKYCLKKYN